jgi:predicted kinase
MALRAIVRAVVTVDRAAQESADVRQTDIQRARRYFGAALDYAAPPAPQMMVIGGLSGTGKSTLASMLAPWVGGTPGAVHLRSDLERKALAGVGEFDRLPASAYADAARSRVYAVLQERARAVLAAGRSVIVDAVFAERERRQDIEALAAALALPCRGVWLQADAEQLMARVAARQNDASDATPDVVLAQAQSDTGSLAPGWPVVDAGGTALETLDRASVVLGVSIPKNRIEQST